MRFPPYTDHAHREWIFLVRCLVLLYLLLPPFGLVLEVGYPFDRFLLCTVSTPLAL